MTRKYTWGILIAAVALVATGAGWWRFQLAGTGTHMTQSASRFLGTLTDQQRQTALLAWDAKDRLDWHFIPKPQRKGLQVKEMTDAQRQAAFVLLSAALSQAGYNKATQIMTLESILRELERNRKDGPIRDPERYYFTLFGAPGTDGRWGLSVEGHHLSLNFVIEGDRVVSSTPTFFGANPAEVKTHFSGGPRSGTRVLRQEEELAFQLFNSLDDAQRAVCLIAEKAPAEIRGAGEPQPPADKPEGLPVSRMSASQTATLRALIVAYTENMPRPVSDQRWEAIEKAGIDQVYFAWAGAAKPGIGHYYRIQGPSFLVELVNTQPDAEGNVANHIHSVWRDMQGDFGLPR